MNNAFAILLAAAVNCCCLTSSLAATFVEETGQSINIEIADNGSATVTETPVFFVSLAVTP